MKHRFWPLALTITLLLITAAVGCGQEAEDVGILTRITRLVEHGTSLADLSEVISSIDFAAGALVRISEGGEALMDCFVVIVVGGFGSLGGALIASLMIGQLQSFGILFVPQLAMVFQFLLMALILVVKPTGLFGEKE